MRCRDIALTCEVGGDSIWTTVARPEVTTVPTTVPGTRPNVTTCVSPWFGQGESPQASGVSPIPLSGIGRGESPPALRVSIAQSIALTCEVGGDPIWTTVSRRVVTTLLTAVRANATKRDHVREHVVRTERKPSSLGRQPDVDIRVRTGCSSGVSPIHLPASRTNVRRFAVGPDERISPR